MPLDPRERLQKRPEDHPVLSLSIPFKYFIAVGQQYAAQSSERVNLTTCTHLTLQMGHHAEKTYD